MHSDGINTAVYSSIFLLPNAIVRVHCKITFPLSKAVNNGYLQLKMV